MKKIHTVIERVAPTDLSVLITGENGVGKEIVARKIYQLSLRRELPFIKINTAAIPENLIESELFGYQRGAFTGADRRKAGRVEAAHKGTLFFDEIGELDLESQSKLLQIIQEGEFTPLGTNQKVNVDIRVLSATNCDLAKAVQGGRFRDDLFHRLNVVHIRVPPLRERLEDIPLLLDHFLKSFTSQFEKDNTLRVEKEHVELLTTYRWPGNVRELENFAKNLVLFEDPRPQLDKLRVRCQEKNGVPSDSTPSLLEVTKMVEEKIERKVISHILKKNGWNRKKTAKVLQISYRSLLGKIKKLGIQ